MNPALAAMAAAAPYLTKDQSVMTEEAKPRGPLAQALSQLEIERALRLDCARELDHASQLRAGLMDSESRQAEVQREMHQVLVNVSKRLRGVQ